MPYYLEVDSEDVIIGLWSKNSRNDNYINDPSKVAITEDQYLELNGIISNGIRKQYIDGVISDAPDIVISDDDFRDYIRVERNKLLTQSDWTQSPDSPLSDTKKQEWATYRQQLRDLPSTASQSNLTWPTKPS